jgi:RHS repeat-associated protein
MAAASMTGVQFVYDIHDRLLRTVFPDGSWEGSSTNSGSVDAGLYDAAGNVLKFRTREGTFLASTYDRLDRKLTEKGLWTDGLTSGFSHEAWRMRDGAFVYTPAGRMTSAATDQVTKAWTYDTAGRPASHVATTPAPTATSFTFTYGWDVAGNLTSLVYPGSLTATWTYDALSRMTGVTTTGAVAASATLAYDTLSRRTSVAFGDGSAQAYAYEADDDLSSMAHTFTASPSTNNVTFTWANDRLGRQVSETTSNAAYLYEPPLSTTAYGAANGLNQYPTVAATAYSYRADGALAGDGVFTFFYDEKRNLAISRQGLAAAGNFDQDAFDALGVRWWSYRSAPAASDPHRRELTDGLRPEVVWEQLSSTAEGSSTPVVAGNRYYVLGPNPDERLIWIDATVTPLKARYPHTNRRGDTIAISKDGAAETKFTYGPFGESSDTTAAYPWRFTGQRLNSWTGLYHFKARAYSPAMGRFLQPDPIGYGDGPNIYAYVENDPFNATDPTGTQDAFIGGMGWGQHIYMYCSGSSDPQCVQKTSAAVAGGSVAAGVAGVAAAPLAAEGGFLGFGAWVGSKFPKQTAAATALVEFVYAAATGQDAKPQVIMGAHIRSMFAGYEMGVTSVVKQSGVFRIEIWGLYAKGGNMFGLARKLKAEAAASGAKEIEIVGTHIINRDLLNLSDAFLKRMGLRVVSKTSDSIVLRGPTK